MNKNVLLIIVGVISLGLSIMCFSANKGEKVYDSIYGGDAFTGIQNASADTGNNVMALSKIVSTGFGSILLVSGLTLIVLGIPSKKEEKEEDEKPVLPPAEVPVAEHAEADEQKA